MEETHSKRGKQWAPRRDGAGATNTGGSHALTTRGSVQEGGLLYFSQLPEQLREKLTGSQSFQQTQVLTWEAVSPEEMGSWGKEGST